MIEPVLDGRCAIGVAGSWAIAPPQLTLETLLTIKAPTVVSAQHPLATHRGPVPRAVLVDHIRISHTDPSDISQSYEPSTHPPRTWRLAHLGAKLAFLRAGFGYGALPQHLVEVDLASGALVQIITEDAPPGGREITMWAVYRTDRPPGPAGRWFIERLKQVQAPARKSTAARSPSASKRKGGRGKDRAH